MSVVGIEDGILDALLDHLSTLSTTLPIAWPDLPFTPVDSYLEAFVTPNVVNQVTLGKDGHNRHEGLMQVNVVQKSGSGVISSAGVGSTIVAHFKRGTVISKNGLNVRTRPPRIAQPIDDSRGWTRMPVIIPWFVDSPNPA